MTLEGLQAVTVAAKPSIFPDWFTMPFSFTLIWNVVATVERLKTVIEDEVSTSRFWFWHVAGVMQAWP
jgi:hypothetical protein